jgi:hypothetical protein
MLHLIMEMGRDWNDGVGHQNGNTDRERVHGAADGLTWRLFVTLDISRRYLLYYP